MCIIKGLLTIPGLPLLWQWLGGPKLDLYSHFLSTGSIIVECLFLDLQEIVVGCLQGGKKFPIHISLCLVHTGSVVTRVITSTRIFSATVSPTAQQTAHPRDRWTRRNAHAQPPPPSSLPQRSLPKERTLRSVRLVRQSLKKCTACTQCIV